MTDKLLISIVLNTNVRGSFLNKMLKHLQANQSMISIVSLHRMSRMNVIVIVDGAQVAMGPSSGANSCAAFQRIQAFVDAGRKYVLSVVMNIIKESLVGRMEILNSGNMRSRTRS